MKDQVYFPQSIQFYLSNMFLLDSPVIRVRVAVVETRAALAQSCSVFLLCSAEPLHRLRAGPAALYSGGPGFQSRGNCLPFLFRFITPIILLPNS